MAMPTALEISRQASLKPVADIAQELGLPPWLVQPYGEHVAKIDLAAIEALADRPQARYIVVTAVTPTRSAVTCAPCRGWRQTRRPSASTSMRTVKLSGWHDWG